MVLVASGKVVNDNYVDEDEVLEPEGADYCEVYQSSQKLRVSREVYGVDFELSVFGTEVRVFH